MKTLSDEKRTQVVSLLVEGMSIRATCRVTGVAKGTVLKLLVDLGTACRAYHDAKVRGLSCRRVQCDEIWSFVGCKDKNVLPDEVGVYGIGSVWTWTAIDADTKLIAGYHVGTRDAGCAYEFMTDLASRIKTRIQLTTDGLKVYINAVADAFGPAHIDYAMLIEVVRPHARRSWPIQPARVPRRRDGAHHGRARHGPCVDVVRRALEPNHPHAEPSLHAPDQRLLKEGGEPGALRRDHVHALQLLPRAPDASRDPGHGRRDRRSRVGR